MNKKQLTEPIPKRMCSLEGCERKHYSRSYCRTHYERLIRHGNPITKLIGDGGMGSLDQFGYRLVYRPHHPNARKNGYMFEHRYVMAEYLERPLIDGETVHHKNGNRSDNRIENLVLMTSKHFQGQSIKDTIAHAESVLREYAPHLLKDNVDE